MKWITVSRDEDVSQSHKQQWTGSCIYNSDDFVPPVLLSFSLLTDVTGKFCFITREADKSLAL
jgi:hypothetical protein